MSLKENIMKFFILVAAAIFIFIKKYKRVDIPQHLLNHPIIYEQNLIEPETAKGLNKIVREMG